jgi:hypothetical protein
VAEGFGRAEKRLVATVLARVERVPLYAVVAALAGAGVGIACHRVLLGIGIALGAVGGAANYYLIKRTLSRAIERRANGAGAFVWPALARLGALGALGLGLAFVSKLLALGFVLALLFFQVVVLSALLRQAFEVSG